MNKKNEREKKEKENGKRTKGGRFTIFYGEIEGLVGGFDKAEGVGLDRPAEECIVHIAMETFVKGADIYIHYIPIL